MLDIANTSKCNGCHACFSVCPVRAISMKSDSEGFLRPVIDYDICTGCGKCESVCPVLHPPILPDDDPVAFACKNTNEDIRLKSSSGGVFTALAESIIDRGGVVFGARFDSDFSVFHGWTDTKEGLESFRGSKYVQSKIGNAFIECKTFLEDGRTVLFTGTPCQIGGLKAFLGNDYDNLYTVDIICKGVLVPLLLKKYIEYHIAKRNDTLVKVAHRDKSLGWKQNSFAMQFKNSMYICISKHDPYMKMYSKNLCLRNSCFDCSFKNISRDSDITIGDFWGIQNVAPNFDDDKGTSLVLLHTKQAKVLFESCSNKVVSKSLLLNSALHSNPMAFTSAKPSRFYDMFFYDLSIHDFTYMHKKYLNDSFLYKLLILIIWNIKKNILRIKGRK